MTPEQFCYWLNGFGELTTETPTPEQWKAIKEHLETVFTKVTPSAPGYLGQDPRRLGQAVASGKLDELNARAMRRREESQAAADREANRIRGHPYDPNTYPGRPDWYFGGLPTMFPLTY